MEFFIVSLQLYPHTQVRFDQSTGSYPYLCTPWGLSLYKTWQLIHFFHLRNRLGSYTNQPRAWILSRTAWQVIEQLAALVLLGKSYHFLNLLWDGSQQIRKLITCLLLTLGGYNQERSLQIQPRTHHLCLFLHISSNLFPDLLVLCHRASWQWVKCFHVGNLSCFWSTVSRPTVHSRGMGYTAPGSPQPSLIFLADFACQP